MGEMNRIWYKEVGRKFSGRTNKALSGCFIISSLFIPYSSPSAQGSELAVEETCYLQLLLSEKFVVG